MFGLVTWSLLSSLRPVLEPDEEEESWLILQQLPWQQLLQLHRHHPEQNGQNTNIEIHRMTHSFQTVFFRQMKHVFYWDYLVCSVFCCVVNASNIKTFLFFPELTAEAFILSTRGEGRKVSKNNQEHKVQEPSGTMKGSLDNYSNNRKTHWITRKTSTTCSKQTALLFASASECPG